MIRSVNREHFERTSADELLVSGQLAGGLLAHSALNPGLSSVIGDLLTFPVGNEFYWLTVGDELAGRTFLEAMDVLKRENDCIALATAGENGQYEANPDGKSELRAGDRLLVISMEQPPDR